MIICIVACALSPRDIQAMRVTVAAHQVRRVVPVTDSLSRGMPSRVVPPQVLCSALG